MSEDNLQGKHLRFSSLCEKYNHCSNCNQPSLDIVEENEDTIYFECFNCGIQDEFYKTSKDDFIEKLEMDYEWEDVCEFADGHFENLCSMEYNIKKFKNYLDMD